MTKRLFVVVNPTQYLNAVEYVYQKGLEEDYMLIMSPFPAGFSRIDEYGAKEIWKKVEFLDLSGYKGAGSDKKFWNDCYSLLSKTFETVQPKELIVGNLVDGIIYPFLLKNKKQFSQVMVLDDGTPTLNVFNKLNTGQFYWTYNFRSLRILLKYIVYLRMFPPFYTVPKRLSFFSLFELKLRQGDLLTKNGYDWLKSRVINNEYEKEFIFVGSHLVDRKLVSKSDYLNSIIEIREIARKEGYTLKYAFHRGESQEMREEIEKICTTIDFDAPLELIYLNKAKPSVLAGHFSSALFTLSRIYPEMQVRAYLLPDNKLNGSEYESKSYLLEVQKALRKDELIHSFELN